MENGYNDTLESVDDTILTDDNNDATEATIEEGSSIDPVISNFLANVDEAVFQNENRPDLDSSLLKAPEYEEDVEELVEEVGEHKLNIEQEALDTNDSNGRYRSDNTRVLPKEATTYELEYFNKHALVIFSQKQIDRHLPRIGTEKDVDSLTRTFKNFGFEVTTHNDLKKDDVFREIEKFSKRDDFTEHGCVAVAILTHGSENGMLWAKDQLYSGIQVINHFMRYSKSTLVTKPKIFIIHASEGTEICSDVLVQPSGRIRKDCADDPEPYYTLPLECDLLFLHSSYPGRVSYRDRDGGSWFIQTLCKQINRLSSTQDLESIIREVKKGVAIEMYYKEVNEETGQTNFNKQMPVITSTLIRKLYLKKVGEQALEEPYVESRRRSESRDEDFLDAVSSSALVQFDPCTCVLERFTYMRNCLTNFVAENPNDRKAQRILDVANTYEDSVKFNKSKDKMCKIISNYLMDKTQDSQSYKYLHFLHVGSKSAQNDLSMPPKSSFSFLDFCLTGIFVATFIFVLRKVKSN